MRARLLSAVHNLRARGGINVTMSLARSRRLRPHRSADQACARARDDSRQRAALTAAIALS